MRTKSLIVLIVFCLSAKLQAQCDSVYFRNTATFINDVSLIDTNKIIGVGDNGYIIRTTNGGKHWENIKTYQTEGLTAIQMLPDGVGYVVGYDRTILKTEDKGKTWFPIEANVFSGYFNPNFAYKDLFFFTSSKGFIVGGFGKLLKTENGGRSWKDTTFNVGSSGFNSISFINDSLGFICGYNNELFKTTNGGFSWQKIDLSFLGTSRALKKVKFIDPNTVFIVGDNGLCIKTTNGGATWTQISTPTSATYNDIYFQNPLQGIIVGGDHISSGIIIKTSNGGNTWTWDLNIPSQSPSFSCITADPSLSKIIIAGGIAFGNMIGYNGRSILSTRNVGISYTTLSLNSSISYYDAFFLNDSTGYIAGGSNSVFKTSDCGETWVPLKKPYVYNPSNHMERVFFLDSLNGYASSDLISRTTDGGKTWVKLPNPAGYPQHFAKQMYFFDTLMGLVMDKTTLFKTINGGATWTNVLDVQSILKDFTFIGNGKGFAVATDGRLYVSSNYGDSWTLQNINTTEYLTSVYFFNDNIGFIGSYNNTLFKTTNGGLTWTQSSIGLGTEEMRSFKFINESVGYLLCSGISSGASLIYKTTNAGASWYIVNEFHENAFRLGGFKTIYTAGGNGLIVKTDTLQKPGIPGYINGPVKACVGDRSAFVTGNMTGMNFNWTLSGGGSNVFNSNKDSVLWNTAGIHTLSVTASNACGTGPARQTIVDVIFFQPLITVEDSVLTATEGLSYEWFRNGNAIPVLDGGHNRSIIGRNSGSYTVKVKSFYGCMVTTPALAYTATVVKTICPGAVTVLASNLSASSYQWQMDDSTGFANISDNVFFAGTNTAYLQLKSTVPSSWYGYKFRCVANVGMSDIFMLQYRNTWTGAVNGNWENAANWSCGKVPDANTDVVISSGTLVINSHVIIRKLAIGAGVNLTVNPGYTLTITH